MDFNLIRTFVVLARVGNLTRAADQLHLSQPALSLQVKKLHEQLGVVLFERTPRGMRLTPAGEQLLPAAERALGEVDRVAAQRFLFAESGRSRGPITGGDTAGPAAQSQA